MDYAKALFALEVRRMAGERTMKEMPAGLTEEEKLAYRSENYEASVESVLAEVDWTMRIIDKQGQ